MFPTFQKDAVFSPGAPALPGRPRVQTRRRRGANIADRHGVTVHASQDWARYWTMLSEHLRARFGADPVHSVEEIRMLAGRFPDNIKLFVAVFRQDIVAGTVIYETDLVAHVQYIASSDLGRKTHALDKLFLYLLREVYAAKAVFDFGISNEDQGRYLNRGLIEQKEGFGARPVVHDFYRLVI
jgi:Acetyltransferase (GNAT) domain